MKRSNIIRPLVLAVLLLAILWVERYVAVGAEMLEKLGSSIKAQEEYNTIRDFSVLMWSMWTTVGLLMYSQELVTMFDKIKIKKDDN